MEYFEFVTFVSFFQKTNYIFIFQNFERTSKCLTKKQMLFIICLLVDFNNFIDMCMASWLEQ